MAENQTGLTSEQLVQEFIKAALAPQDINEEGRKEPYTWTAPEISKEFSISRRQSRMILNRMVRDNILYPAKVWRINDWGDTNRVKGYKLCEDFKRKHEQEGAAEE